MFCFSLTIKIFLMGSPLMVLLWMKVVKMLVKYVMEVKMDRPGAARKDAP